MPSTSAPDGAASMVRMPGPAPDIDDPVSRDKFCLRQHFFGEKASIGFELFFVAGRDRVPALRLLIER
jgi:hypothetical protein